MSDYFSGKLSKEGDKIINYIADNINLSGKKIDSSDAEKIADVLIANIPINWKSIINEIKPIIEYCLKDSVKLVAAQIDVIESNKSMKLMFTEARDWAKERAADLVGMKLVDGKLTTNPNPEYAITESTRDFIRADVVNAIEQGLSVQELSKTLQENYAFSKVRSNAIARTETAAASMEGALISYRQAESYGLKLYKTWSTVGDDKVSDECLLNEADGMIPLKDKFSSGADAPPEHINCRCGIIPYAEENTENQD